MSLDGPSKLHRRGRCYELFCGRTFGRSEQQAALPRNNQLLRAGKLKLYESKLVAGPCRQLIRGSRAGSKHLHSPFDRRRRCATLGHTRGGEGDVLSYGEWIGVTSFHFAFRQHATWSRAEMIVRGQLFC